MNTLQRVTAKNTILLMGMLAVILAVSTDASAAVRHPEVLPMPARPIFDLWVLDLFEKFRWLMIAIT